MNLDLLIKLVKLANNNPNDNEANLAARKVCKMIAEGNYNFGQVKKASDKIPNAPRGSWVEYDQYKPPSNYQSASNPYTGNSSNPYSGDFNPFEDFFRQRSREGWRSRQEQNEKYYKPWVDPRPEEPRKKEPSEKTCTRCGFVANTTREETPFVCGICHWTDFDSRRK